MYHTLPRKAAFYTETTFVTGGPADWAADGSYFYLTGVDTSSVVQAFVANENNVTRPRFKHDNIPTLRNCSMSFGCYLHSNPTVAAEGAAATTYHVAELAYAAIGGRDLGFASAVVTSGDEETNEIEIDADPGFVVGDFVYYLSEDGVGEFYRILAIAAGPPITLTVDRPVHVAVADRSVSDTLRAVIDCFIHAYATTQPSHANHKTLQFLVQGDAAEDVVITKGCKPSMSIEGIGAGTPLQMSFDIAVTTFEGADEAAKAAFGAAVPLGESPLVAAKATTTKVKLADFGSPLATVEARGTLTAAPGVSYAPVTGPNGHEGVHGYIDSIEDSTVELFVPHSDAYSAEFRAHTRKQLLIQVGEGTESIGIYYPELEYAGEPVRSDEGAVTGSSLSFRAHENSASAAGITGEDNIEKWRSGFHLLLLA